MVASEPFEPSGYSLHAHGPEGIGFSTLLPESLGGQVTRLSPTVAWVLPTRPEAALLRHSAYQLYLEGGGTVIGPLWGQVLQPQAQATPGAPVGLRLLEVSLEQGRQILAMLGEALRRGVAEPVASALPSAEEIVEAERIRAVLQGIAAVSNKGVLRRAGQTVRVALEHYDAHAQRVTWRTEDAGARWGEPPYDIDVIGYNSAFRLRLEQVREEQGALVSALPRRLWRIRHRWHRRVPAPPAARVRFEHPLWGELGTLQREVLDISLGGLRLGAPADELLFPGLRLPRLELETGQGPPVLLSGEVRYVAQRGAGPARCGLSVQPLPGHEAHWVHFVSQVLCPTTRSSENLIEPLWELFVLSGYFSMAGRTPESFEEARQDFVRMARRAAQLPQLFCQTVWPSERGIEATQSLMKPYLHTWMTHQLARRPGKPPAVAHEPGQILRDIYLRTFEHATSDAEHRWCLAYLESRSPFVERAHIRYARRLMDSERDVYTAPVRMMRAHCEGAAPPPEPLTLGPPTAQERALLLRALAATRPECYLEALDLTPERLGLEEISALWRHQGLTRVRHLRVARAPEGTALAALVMELGPPGTNLFNLLDMARLVPLGPASDAACVALLDEARRWYAGQGRTRFTYVHEEGTTVPSFAQAARLEDSPEAAPFLWILPARLVPDFLEHISEQTVGRQARTRPAG